MYGYCKVIISSLSQKSRVPYGGNPSSAWEQATNAKFSINAVIIWNKTKALFYCDCFCLGQGIEINGEKNCNSETIKGTCRFVKFHFKKKLRLCRYRNRTSNALPSDDYFTTKIEGEHIRNVEFQKQASSAEVRGIHYIHCPKAYPHTSNASLKINWRKQNLFFVTRMSAMTVVCTEFRQNVSHS